MDIKNVLNAVIPPQILGKEKVERTIKSDSTTDRDGNGQMPSGGEQEHHPPMSDEQLKKAIQHLQNLSVVKDHNLIIQLSESEGKNVFMILDAEGKVIRRILEQEMWSLFAAKDKDKGQLLRKTA